jgi:hypothetical protein
MKRSGGPENAGWNRNSIAKGDNKLQAPLFFFDPFDSYSATCRTRSTREREQGITGGRVDPLNECCRQEEYGVMDGASRG